jgi:hypothetical protein
MQTMTSPESLRPTITVATELARPYRASVSVDPVTGTQLIFSHRDRLPLHLDMITIRLDEEEKAIAAALEHWESSPRHRRASGSGPLPPRGA